MSVVFSKENYEAVSHFHHIQSIHHILLLCGRGIGDVLLTLPAISCLKNTYPEAYITTISSPHSAQFLHECGYIQNVVCFDTRYSKNKVKDFFFVVFLLLFKNFDLSINFGKRFSYSFFTFIARARYKVGRSHEKSSKLYNITDHIIFPKNTIHEIERNLRLVSMIAHVNGFSLPFVKIKENERTWIEEFMGKIFPQDDKKIVCFHIGGSFSYKLWPVEKYSALIRRFADLSNVEILVIYGPEEEYLSKEFNRQNNGGCHQFCPRNISQLKAVISRVDLIICNDSGPMHIADALNIPLVAIFGGTDYKRWQPLSSKAVLVRQHLDCWPCDAYYCSKGWVCIKELPVETVWKAARRLIFDQTEQ